MPTAERTRAERRKHKARVWGYVSAAVMCIGAWLLPRSPTAMVLGGMIVFACAIPAALNGYFYKAKWYVWVPILLGHAVVIIAVLWAIWPRVKVSPARVTFAGFQNETFNFSVRNETADDVYDVQVPFFLGTHSHLDSAFSATVISNGEPSPHIFGDYNYCYGKDDGDIHNVLPNEQEVLVVHVSHISPMGNRSFSISYTGGKKLEAKAEAPTFILTPYSFSDMRGTIGVRGNFRICKFVSANERAVPQ